MLRPPSAEASSADPARRLLVSPPVSIEPRAGYEPTSGWRQSLAAVRDRW